MKQFYCSASMVAAYIACFYAVANPYEGDLRADLTLADVLGFSFMLWIFIGFPIFMLFNDPQRTQGAK